LTDRPDQHRREESDVDAPECRGKNGSVDEGRGGEEGQNGRPDSVQLAFGAVPELCKRFVRRVREPPISYPRVSRRHTCRLRGVPKGSREIRVIERDAGSDPHAGMIGVGGGVNSEMQRGGQGMQRNRM
jgi:hypothetical protein